MAHPQEVAVTRIMQRRIDAGQLDIDLTQWLFRECVYLERTLAAVLDMSCGKHPALCAAILEEAQNRARCEMGL
jgi:hypothetical protein